MQRYPAYDPPEYVDWEPEPALTEACLSAIRSEPERDAVVAALGEEQLLDLYRGMVRFRLHDVAL
ncbi:MAG: hypothetical protein ACE5FP_02370, partial [Gemmatimonadota bacterium]